MQKFSKDLFFDVGLPLETKMMLKCYVSCAHAWQHMRPFSIL